MRGTWAVAACAAALIGSQVRASGEVLSLNIAAGRNGASASMEATVPSGSETYGFVAVPGDAWVNTARVTTETSLTWKQYDPAAGTTTDVALDTTITGGSPWTLNAEEVTAAVAEKNNMLVSYIDDSSTPTITIKEIPFSSYKVIVYASTDTANYKFSPVTVNDVQYTASNGITLKGSSTWGATRQATLTEGTNVLVVEGQTASTLVVKGGENANSARGGIAAIQVVNTTGETPSSQEFTASPTESAVTFSTIAWENGATFAEGERNLATITLQAGATLTMDQAPKLAKMTLIAAGDVTIQGTETVATPFANVGLVDGSGITGVVTFAVQPSEGSLSTMGNVKLSGGAAVTDFNPRNYLRNGATLTIAKAVSSAESASLVEDPANAANFILWQNGTLNIQDGAEITISEGGYFRSRNFSNNETENVINQTGGTFTVKSASDNYKTGAVTLSLTGGMTTYNLSGGKLSVPNGWVRGGDGSFTINLSGNGVLETKKFNGCSGWNPGILKVSGSAVFRTDSFTYTKVGGTPEASSSFELADGSVGPWTETALTFPKATVSGAAEINTSTKDGAAATVSVTTLTVGDAGSIAVAGNGTFALQDGQRPRLASVASGAKVKFTATAAEIGALAVTFPTTATDASGFTKANFEILNATGEVITQAADPSVADGVLTLALPSTYPTLSTGGAWSTATWSNATSAPTSGVVYVIGGNTADAAITVSMDTDLSNIERLAVVGHVKFTKTDAQSTLPTTIALDADAVLTADTGFAGEYTIPAGTTVVLEAVSSDKKLTVNGTLCTTGTTELSAQNVINDTGLLNVQSGTTTLTTPGGGEGIKGNLTVASGAVLESGVGDAPRYSDAQTFDIAGTLRLLDQTRWTISSGITFNLRAGAKLEGACNSGVNPYAFDFWEGGTITTFGDVEIAASMGAHLADKTLTISCADGTTTTVTGVIRSGVLVKKAGSGNARLRIESVCTHTGGITVETGYLTFAGAGTVAANCPITVQSGMALELCPTTAALSLPCAITNNGRIDAFASTDGTLGTTLTGTISGEGNINVKEANASLTYEPAADTSLNGVVNVEAEATMAFAMGAHALTLAKQLAACSGTLVVRSGTVVAANANGNFAGKWVIDKGAVLTNRGNGNYNPFIGGSGSIETNGELRMEGTADDSHIYGVIKGTGDVTVNHTSSIHGDMLFKGTLTIASEVDLQNVAFLNGPSICCNGTLSTAENATLRLASGKVLSGSGSIGGDFLFDSGAIIDATATSGTAFPCLTGTVTLPSASVLVRASNFGIVLNASNLDATKFALAADTSLSAAVFDVVGDYLYMLQKPTLPTGSDSAAAEAIAKEALASGGLFTKVTSVTVGTGCSADAVLLFDNVVKFTAVPDDISAATASIAYDFGISAIQPNVGATGAIDSVDVTVKVVGREATGVLIAAGTTLTLNDKAGNVLATKRVDTAASEVTFEGLSLANTLTSGKTFTVKVSN